LTPYYVVAINTANFPLSGVTAQFQLSLTPGGAPIAATSAGSGTQTINLVVPSYPVGYGNASPIVFGTQNISGPVCAWNPAFAVSRCVVVTSNGADSTVGTYTVAGYDIYGYPMTQVLAGVSSGTVTSTKAFKYISSVTPSAGVVSTALSVGTTDIIGIPLRTDAFPYLHVWWGTADPTLQTVDTTPNFVSADISVPSGTTGDVRGTFNIGALFATNGTRRLLVFRTLLPANLTTTAGVLGQTQF
jgi:hypothetical protein